MKQSRVILSLIFVMVMSVISSFAQSNSEKDVKFYFELSGGDKKENRSTFTVGEKIIIKAFLANNSTEPFPFRVTDENYLYRFSLFSISEGKPIGYRKDKAAIMSAREKESGAGMFLRLEPIASGETKMLATMRLDDRYEDLAPGKYRLLIEYKSGKGVQKTNLPERENLLLSYETTFEIIA